ncbi:MAG TPA: hypothetical protein VJ718_00765 [Candidatus Binataceae bacterium]|nr:hypothetical protein [Candidatus Binataceae bacterium]
MGQQRQPTQLQSTATHLQRQTNPSNGVPTPGRRDPLEFDLTLLARLDARFRQHEAAGRRLQRIVRRPAVFEMARGMYDVFWDVSIEEAIAKEAMRISREVRRRVGAGTAWLTRNGRSTAELRAASDAIERILNRQKRNGRPNKDFFQDMVAACAIAFRVDYGGARVPSYTPLARYLELPEMGYPLTAHSVTTIATEVVRRCGADEGAKRYPASYGNLALAAPFLLRQHQSRELSDR